MPNCYDHATFSPFFYIRQASIFVTAAADMKKMLVNEIIFRTFQEGYYSITVDVHVLDSKPNLEYRIKSFITSIDEITELTTGRFGGADIGRKADSIFMIPVPVLKSSVYRPRCY